MRRRSAWVIPALAALLWLAPLAQVFAAGFEVRPVLVETADGLGTLTVSNPGATRLYIQGTLYRWSYDTDGVQVLAAVPNVIVSPPATWIKPGSEYRFRLKVPQAAPGQELSFRLLLSEVPTRDTITNGAVMMTVTQSIPVFSEGKSLKSPSLSATLVGSTLLIHNSGGRHVRIAQLMQDGRVVKSGLVGYALSGSLLAVHLKIPIHPGRIEFTTDLGLQTLVVTE
ncbi:MAG: fimbria/pilus periplasmic chaperone [Gammaproteobacteria bacterium]